MFLEVSIFPMSMLCWTTTSPHIARTTSIELEELRVRAVLEKQWRWWHSTTLNFTSELSIFSANSCLCSRQKKMKWWRCKSESEKRSEPPASSSRTLRTSVDLRQSSRTSRTTTRNISTVHGSEWESREVVTPEVAKRRNLKVKFLFLFCGSIKSFLCKHD